MFRLEVFCFLWDDPVFNPGGAEAFLELGKIDPAWLAEKRRDMTLDTLNVLFRDIAALQERLDAWKERAARAMWVVERLRPHTAADIVEQVMIDVQVAKDIDPTFSFCKAIGLK